MKRQILIGSLVLLAMQTVAAAGVRPVPLVYPTIQEAINASVNGDVVVVAPRVYTGYGNVDLDFGGKVITVQSQINPNNPIPAIIASTIIDCQGSRDDPHRAFWFHSGEGPNSKVLGFTIINGYVRGPKGDDGSVTDDPTGEPIDEEDPDSPPRANSGKDASGDGYGGAILCDDASPTIKYCVITNCTVTGGQGGHGADGQWGTWTFEIPPEDPEGDPEVVEVDDGQWGGYGGVGTGYGYGGAIACIGGSSPIISDCTIKDNIARGGCGGDGGDGGNAAGEFPDYDGNQGGSGSGGEAEGDGIGGGLYAEGGSSPIITNCDFRNNVATQALGGAPGVLGVGDVDADPPQPVNGVTGQSTTWGGIAGGAAYYGVNSHPDFTDCTFESNKAYEVIFGGQYGSDVFVYTIGGALYSEAGNTIDLNNCQFTLNLGGAVYCQNNNVLNFDDCLFRNNSDTCNGGAIYVSRGGTVNLQNCNLTGNSARLDGGALNCKSDAVITNCFFGGNRALGGDGGGIEAYYSGTTLTLDFDGCTFGGNDAIWGGGVHFQEFESTFTDCYFVGNTAEIGAGLLLSDGTVSVVGGAINGNYTYGTFGIGGGLACINTAAEISNCAITDNLADGANASGGGITFYGGFLTHVVTNCQITGNYATVSGGAISCNLFATPEFGNCTFSDNTAGSLGGAIFCDWGSDAQITDCIFENCNSHAVCEEDYDGTVIKNSLFYNNPDGDYWDGGASRTFTSVPDNDGNFNDDPRFVTGPLGDYYLNQSDSPAVDAGSDTAVNLGMNVYTTATNDVPDTGQVDIGYHYPVSSGIAQYQLTVTVTGGHGTAEATDPGPVDYDPASGIYTYRGGTIVTLTAQPDAGWRVKQWAGGTVDDASTSRVNLVVMTSDRNITIECEKGRTLEVGPEGNYADIQSAVQDANDGDTIVVDTGIWYLNENYLVVDKSIVITSKEPDNPACVQETIIDGLLGTNEWTVYGFTFGSNTDSGTVLNGFTIQNCGGFALYSFDGNRGWGHPDGYDGTSLLGPAITLLPFANVTVKNCIITDNQIIAGIGGDGENATSDENAGRGGWGGWARGGAIYCGLNSKLTLINCQIIDNQAVGGDGGDGGDDVFPGGEANYGGNWSRAEVLYYDPFSLDIILVSGDLWEVWQCDNALFYYLNYGIGNGYGYIGDYRWYSGYGGGVYCDKGSTVTFTDCTISGNLAQGGMSGQGGAILPSLRPELPLIAFEIPSFGGGVYCAADSEVTFTGCTLTDNISSDPTFDHSLYDEDLPDGYDPVNTHRLDPYLGHGAGVCAERSATVVFNDCLVSGNEAAVGGGLYWARTTSTISDCNFAGNSAFLGGAMASMEASGTIIGTTIANNNAAFTDEEGLGDGGGVHFWETDAQLLDCLITGNQAGGSGGGVYFGGDGYESFSLKLHNCLVANNTSVTSGGGVSCGWYSEPDIINCTISDNITEGDPEPGGDRGGGLYCGYHTNANVINSILWGNTADNGNQIAIGSAPAPSTVTVSYSDVQGGEAGVWVDPGCTLEWLDGNFTGTGLSNPLFVEGYFLSEPDTGRPGQTQLSPCVDAGLGQVGSLPLGRYRYTTRTDNGNDQDPIDMSFHYRKRGKFVRGDIDYSGEVDLGDLHLLLEYWLERGCGFPDWCEGADINHDGTVSWFDEAILAQLFGAGDTTAPVPNPSTWEAPPVSLAAASVYMKATPAGDNSGGQVQYYFDCTYGPGHDSGWQDSPEYEDTGLQAGTEYGYKVRARDNKVPDNPDACNKTVWSVIGYVVPGEDTVPPSPDPSEWQTPPYGSGLDSIRMVAETASDHPSDPVEYYFQCTAGLAYGGDNSGWQGSPIYEDIGLEVGITYCYQVRTRDVLQNEGGWSEEACSTTEEVPEPPDTEPPTPLGWDQTPYEYQGAQGYYYHTMSAQEAFDDSDVVLYYFESSYGVVPSSGWQESPSYNVLVSYTGSVPCCYKIGLRDEHGNTVWMGEEQAECTF